MRKDSDDQGSFFGAIPLMHQDPNEQFAGNSSINAEIHELLAFFSEPSCSRMRKKIRQDGRALQKQGTDQSDENARHTFREFLVARRLNENGCRLEYGKNIEGQTPDWYDEQNRFLLEVFTCERGGKSAPGQRVATRIAEKVTKYGQVVRDKALSFVVAVHGDFLSFFLAEDCEQAIKDGGVFEAYSDLSGIIFFAEGNALRVPQPDGSMGLKQDYRFTYFGNPHALRKIDLAAKFSLAARQGEVVSRCKLPDGFA